jgi:hypothetical protein
LKIAKLITLFMAINLTACLPPEKTVQCNNNATYNADEKECIAPLTVSSTNTNITISNVSPPNDYVLNSTATSPTHAVTILDPSHEGYAVQWYITDATNTITLLDSGLSLTFKHTAFEPGVYTVSAVIFDVTATERLIAYDWNISITDNASPLLTAITDSPLATTTTASGTSTVSATATNPDSLANINFQWYVNGSAVVGESGTFSGMTQAISFNFDPTNITNYYQGVDTYLIELYLLENTTDYIYSSESWVISSTAPAYANITLGTSSTFSITTDTPDTDSVITVIDNLAIQSSSFLNDVDNDGDYDPVDFCVQTDDILGVDGDGVFVDFLLNGSEINVAATNIQLAVANTSYCLKDYYNFLINIPSSPPTSTQIITAIIYDKDTDATNTHTLYKTFTQIETFSWSLKIRQQNTAPTISVDTTNTNIAYDTDGDNIGDTDHSCTSTAATIETGCHISQDTPFMVAINVKDDDYDPEDISGSGIGYEKFKVEFKIDNVLLDGVTPIISTSDCYHDFIQTNTLTRYICTLTINSYDTSGPVTGAGQEYTLTAKVTDADSPYGGTNLLESNIVTWKISTVSESNTAPIVNAFDTTAGATIATESYIALQSASGVAINANVGGALIEGDKIEIIVNVTDLERDGHTISISRCADVLCAVVNELDMISKVITSTDNTNPRISIINHTIAEDEVVGDDEALVYYQIIVEDSEGNTSSTVATLEIEDFNPSPVFTGTLLPITATTYKTFVGFPFSIDGGTFTDASAIVASDGENISYQWMYSTDGVANNWSPITGATSAKLTWTPSSEIDFISQAGTNVKLKLCIGDDGWDSVLDLARTAMNAAQDDCIAGRDSEDYDSDGVGPIVNAPWSVDVYSNMTNGFAYEEDQNNNTGAGQLAIWVDPSSTNPIVKYLAYQSNANELVIEKILTYTDGTKGGSNSSAANIIATTAEVKTIRYKTTSTANNAITNFSMIGDATNKALYIAFLSPYSGEGGNNSVHIRRIDIGTGKSSYTHPAKFGVDRDFDGLEDNITITSAEISTESTNSDGLIQFSVNLIDPSVSTITFSGIMGGAITLTEGIDFCVVACVTTVEMTNSIISAINTSTDSELQGITAMQQELTTVVLEGIAANDFIQKDVSAYALGKIVVNHTTGKWELPFIDMAKTGSDKFKISLLYGNLDSPLDETNLSSSFLSSSSPSSEIANTLSIGGATMLLASKVYPTGQIVLNEFTTSVGPTYSIIDANTDLFSTSLINNLKLTVGKTSANTSAYLVGKNNSTNAIAYARVDSISGNYSLSSTYTTTDLNSSYAMFTDTTNFDIAAGAKAQELFIGTMDITDRAIYVMQVKGTTPSLNCNADHSSMSSQLNCQKIQTNSTTDVFNLSIAMSDVFENIALGTDGNTIGESIKDIIVFGFHSDDGGGNSAVDAIPTMAIINVEETSITGDVTGTTYDVTYGIPYVAP